ncbi:hypothetical protein HZ994_09445 [Akkermansiaceae bacterium]|nr:hypothetical protein HZ994_09445 [Akkermansiaceae bacterium]
MISRLFILIALFIQCSLHGGELELVSVTQLPENDTKEITPEEKRTNWAAEGDQRFYEAIRGTLELVVDVESDKKLLGVRLTNTSKHEVKVSWMRLCMDESYDLWVEGNRVPNAFNNHQALGEIENLREDAGTRWLELDPGQSVILSIAPFSQWSNLSDFAEGKEVLSVEIRPAIFAGRRVRMDFAKTTEE